MEGGKRRNTFTDDGSRLQSPKFGSLFVFYRYTGRPKFTPNAHSSTAFETKDLRGVFLLVMGVVDGLLDRHWFEQIEVCDANNCRLARVGEKRA
jgi:hypothetical protein